MARRVIGKNKGEIAPDEILLDSQNLPEFDQSQFEGRIVSPISRSTIVVMGLLFLLVGILYLGRISMLQIGKSRRDFEKTLASVNNNQI